jgi:hypothetical protein
MPQLEAHGLTLHTPGGWEGRIFRRPQHGEVSTSASGDAPGAPAPPGEQTFPVMHAATIALPPAVADYCSDAVTELGPNDAIVVLKEFAPAATSKALYASVGLPRPLDPDGFNPAVLQRRLPGQAGLQRFFQEGGRAFCLYVVLGGFNNRQSVVPGVNTVLSGIQIVPSSPASP